ncbi:MAG: anaerobic ribonucleoside-triphosphate reductase activating protein [Bacteroidia bacterium]|nr:MAG: anaerobic ribonucleoside-triphosphate reductase activating protein [Bacteroidia bacterium]
MLKYTDYDIVFQEIPNEVTLAINLSNCPHRCVGCHSPQLMQDIGNRLTESTLTDLLSKYGSSITCVCFMGGDASPDTKINNFNFIKVGGYKEHLGGLDSKTTNQRLYKVEESRMDDITHLMQR